MNTRQPSKGPREAFDDALSRLERTIRARLALGEMPRFALPPKGVALIACLDDVPKIARNAVAKRLVAEVTSEIADGITLSMLDAVLEACNVPVERVPAADLKPQLRSLADSTEPLWR